VATYEELYHLFSNASLANRVEVACVVAANTVHNEPPATENHTARLVWARNILSNPTGGRTEMLRAVLAAHPDLSVAAISNVTDAMLLSSVLAVVDLFATGS